jgi:uncharacterized membrane protein YukC
MRGLKSNYKIAERRTDLKERWDECEKDLVDFENWNTLTEQLSERIRELENALANQAMIIDKEWRNFWQGYAMGVLSMMLLFAAYVMWIRI